MLIQRLPVTKNRKAIFAQIKCVDRDVGQTTRKDGNIWIDVDKSQTRREKLYLLGITREKKKLGLWYTHDLA